MDADIVQADALALERIRTQAYRDHVAAAQRNADFVAAEGANLLDWRQELRLNIIEAIGANYMKPTTATVDASIVAANALAVKKLKLAVDSLVAFIAPGA